MLFLVICKYFLNVKNIFATQNTFFVHYSIMVRPRSGYSYYYTHNTQQRVPLTVFTLPSPRPFHYMFFGVTCWFILPYLRNFKLDTFPNSLYSVRFTFKKFAAVKYHCFTAKEHVNGRTGAVTCLNKLSCGIIHIWVHDFISNDRYKCWICL